MSDYTTKRELQARKENHCDDCGAELVGGECEWCARFDAIIAENPRGRDLEDFVGRLQGEVLHT